MTRDNFYNGILDHLREYAKLRDIPVIVPTEEHDYSYIINTRGLNKSEKKERICKYNILPNVQSCKEFQVLFSQEKISFQAYANHLNSSQIMCINFFIPMLKWDELNKKFIPNSRLVQWMKEFIDPGIAIGKDSCCKLEFVQDSDKFPKEENTNFDFYIKSNNKEYFFEIKYTENGFGTYDSKSQHNQDIRYNELYKRMIKESVLDETELVSAISYKKYYQLMRNIVRVTSQNTFSIFIFPKDNKRCNTMLLDFKENYVKALRDQIVCLHWEDVVDYKNQKDFVEKYLDI